MTTLRSDLEVRIVAIDGVAVSESQFGHGDAYWVNGKEIAHFEGDGEIEIRLAKAEIRERRPAFKADDRVTLRPSGADWVTVRFERNDDVAFVVDMVSAAADAHRPPPGVTASRPRLEPTCAGGSDSIDLP